jgi:hypothetical protein
MAVVVGLPPLSAPMWCPTVELDREPMIRICEVEADDSSAGSDLELPHRLGQAMRSDEPKRPALQSALGHTVDAITSKFAQPTAPAEPPELGAVDIRQKSSRADQAAPERFVHRVFEVVR